MFVFLLVALFGCGLFAPPWSVLPPDASDYQRALADARDPRKSEIATLRPVRPEEPGLRWDAKRERVLVVTWDGPRPRFRAGSQTAESDVWVTVVPEVQIRCRQPRFTEGAGDEDALHSRLVQLIGLPPGTRYDTFLEMWVEPENLFRACPDPEIQDRTCSLEFPRGVSAEHRQWIEDLRATTYGTPRNPYRGYPWTQLGYNYDWSPTSRNHRGPSEFVIRRGSEIEVVWQVSTDDYCRNASRNDAR